MSCNVVTSLIYAALMIAFALLARMGFADRTTVEILLLVMPILWATQLFRRRKHTCSSDPAAA